MPFKVAYFCQWTGERSGGWSENYWNNNTDLASVITAANGLRFPLDNCHGRQTGIPFIRISDATSFREVTILTFPLGITPPGSTPNDADSDFPTTALLLKFNGPNGYVVRQWLKGTWDGITSRGGIYSPTPTFVGNINGLVSTLTTGSNQWVLRCLDKTVPALPIADISQAGVVTVPGHPYATNDRIRISRARGLTQANKIWRVTKIDANTFSLIGWIVPTVVTPYLGNGTARKQTYTFVPIVAGKVDRVTEHHVGRPFGLLVGRRKRRAI
jgi:hypothetical protein